MIVKVQVAFNQKDNVLVYNEDKTIIFQTESEKITDMMNGNMKAFFHAEIEDGNLNLIEEAPWQDW